MSLITCCPACQTMFKVSGEDLRVSDGWVRCGKCDGVFDASAHLQVMPPEQEAVNYEPDPGQVQNSYQSPYQNPYPSPFQEPVTQPAPDIAASPPPAFTAPTAPMVTMAASVASISPAAERPSLLRAASSGESPANTPAQTNALDADKSSRQPPSRHERPDYSPSVFRREDRDPRPPMPEKDKLSFMSGAPRRRSPWRGPMWLLVSALLLAAAFFGVRHERQALVQALPPTLPALEWLCRISACEVQAPRLLDAVVIDSASMEEDATGGFRVQLVLKNTGPIPVAMPALDVTLTSSKGEVLLRHIALPALFAPQSSRLQPSLPLTVALTIPPLQPVPSVPPVQALQPAPVSMPAPTSTPAAQTPAAPTAAPAEGSELAASASSSPVSAVSGYRVLAFYP